MEIIKLREDYIKLGQALKAAGLAESGVEAKYAAQRVDKYAPRGRPCIRKRRDCLSARKKTGGR